MNRLFAGIYLSLRRQVRAVIGRSRVLDRVVGDRLRRLERKVPVVKIAGSLAQPGYVICHGLRLHYPPHDPTTVVSILLHGDYEPETRAVVQKSLKPGMTFVDLGANIGYFTVIAGKSISPGGRVYAFEPLPPIADYLERNIRENGLQDVVRVERLAVSDQSGVVRFSAGETSSVGAHIADTSGAGIDVPTVSLDDHFARAGWPRVDFVKMDIEGAELAALRGMRELARRSQRLTLVFEFLYDRFGDGGATELFDTLRQLGFMRFRILHRDGETLQLPEQITGLLALSKRTNVNVLAEKY
jgi:FkbM family methyltransferase